MGLGVGWRRNLLRGLIPRRGHSYWCSCLKSEKHIYEATCNSAYERHQRQKLHQKILPLARRRTICKQYASQRATTIRVSSADPGASGLRRGRCTT
ncbi:uncharacterized protein Dsimw501_GD29286 [Drosophila simulans]|nr:uncharacterized protein Dsimw501_GD29286 [Drosophila simulans]